MESVWRTESVAVQFATIFYLGIVDSGKFYRYGIAHDAI